MTPRDAGDEEDEETASPTDWSKLRPRRLKGKERLVLPLAGIRKATGKTQVQVAEALETDQAGVSRIESRPDVMLSTLRRYAAALGGRFEGAIVFGDGSRGIVLAEPKE